MRTARTLVILFTGAFFGAVNCKQVLSIEDAELDPTLGAGGTAGSAGTGGDQQDGRAGSGGTGGSAGDAGGDVVVPASLCDEYCITLFTNCTGENEVYEDQDACLATCALLDEGAPEERGNTVHCRLAAAKQAKTIEPRFYCPRAGPGGFAPADTNPCATNCESLCLLMERVCNDSDAGVDYFDTTATCLAECDDVPDLGILSTAPGRGQLYGNSVQCRLIHVTNSAIEPADHCAHAAGRNTCTDPDGG